MRLVAPAARAAIVCAPALSCALAAGCSSVLVAGPVPAPPPALVGTPAAATAERVITAEDLVRLRDIDTFTVSPDGSRVAYLLRRADHERDAYDTGWFVADVAGEAPSVYLGDAGEPQLATRPNGHQVGEVQPAPARWSPDGRWIAYLVQRDGQVQLWRSRADGRRREQLTQLPADVRRFRWAPDGGAVVVSTSRRTRAEAAAARAAEARNGFVFDDRFHPSHATGPYYRAEAEDRAWWIVDPLSRRVRAVAETAVAALESSSAHSASQETLTAGAPGGAADLQASPDGRALAWMTGAADTERGGEAHQLFAALVPNQEIRCPHEACAGSLRLLGWSGDGAEVIFRRRFGLARRSTGLYAWSPREGRVREILATDALIEDCQLARDIAVCAHEAATTPRRLVAVDLRDGALRTIIDPNPELEAVRFGGVEVVDLTNRFGHEAFAHILTPPDYAPGRRYPAIVVTYRSRGFLRGGVGDEYPPHLFTAAGFVVLSFDMPDADLYPTPDSATADWPGCPECAARVLRHRSAAASLELGLAALERRELMDPDRIAVTGVSSGASIALDALAGSDHRFAAAIVSYAVGDPLSVYVSPRAWRERTLHAVGGLPHEGGRAYFERVSPAWNAERITAPILFNVSDRELVMSMQTIAALEHKKRPIEVLVYPDERHVKRSPAHRYAIYRRNLQWLRFWLQGVEPRDPLDPAQVARWQGLRALQACAPEGAPT